VGEATVPKDAEQFVREDGTYPTVPLRKSKIAISVVQTISRPVDPENPEPGLQENLRYILDCIDRAHNTGPSDLMCFHEFPIQGFRRYTLRQMQRIAFEAPGPEFAEIGRKAKQYNCYIAMGALTKDPDWPGHVMNMQVMVGPTGEVIAKHWKQRAKRGTRRGSEQFTTCIYDVLDRFVEMYGWDAVIPVVRTDIGNIAMSAVQYEPELFRCMALKGAEIIVRTATGGFRWEDMMMCSYHNDVFTAVVNNPLSLHKDRVGFEEYGNKNNWVGRSSIFGPKGVVLAEAGMFETKRRAVIRMGEYREEHRLPDVHFTLYRHVINQYRERYDPNMWLSYVPQNGADAARYLKDKARWQSYSSEE
jgi:predicted amidohydrolase